MSNGYTSGDTSLLYLIREDILARPAFYADGAAYLSQHFGPERTRQVAMEEWEELKSRLGDLAGDPLKPAQWSAAACACQAIRYFLKRKAFAFREVWAKAICILFVLLEDPEADKRNPVFDVFGGWGITPEDKIEELSRGMASSVLYDNPRYRQRWMVRVRKAWGVLPKAKVAPANVLHANASASATARRLGARRKRRKHNAGFKPLTLRQQQAYQLFADFRGQIGKVAEAMGIAHSTARQHVQVAEQKLRTMPRSYASVRASGLPHDRRGQVMVEDDNVGTL